MVAEIVERNNLQVMEMTHTNNVMKILNTRGFKSMQPTEDLLAKLNVNRTRFRRILNNEVKINPLEMKSFALWLGVADGEIITPKKNK